MNVITTEKEFDIFVKKYVNNYDTIILKHKFVNTSILFFYDLGIGIFFDILPVHLQHILLLH